MKIAQVATADCSIRILLFDHIRALQEQGHEVTAVCSPGPWTKGLREAGIDLELVEMTRELDPLRDVKSLVRLTQVFRRREFDVVHTHTAKAGLLGPLAARLAGVQMVVHTIHGLMFHDRMPRTKRSIFWLAEKFTASFAHHLLSQSDEDVRVAVRTGLCAPERITYLGNGIDIRKFSPQVVASSRDVIRQAFGFEDRDFVIGGVARLVYEKGCGELFDAAEQLVARYRHIRFLMIGQPENGQSDSVSAEQLVSLSQSGAVVFAGWRDDMPECYAAMDAFLLPSHREGVPRACMEAAAMQLPVIATDIRGCREVVRHGETGLLIPVKDVDAIVGAVEELFADRERARAMGRRGRQHILAHFDSNAVLDRLGAFYAALGNGDLRRFAAA